MALERMFFMLLLCPKCKQALQKIEHSYCCEQHHTYDIAKSGYTSLLLTNKKTTGDNKEMVQARTRFLQHAYYAPLQKRLCELLQEKNPSVVVDAGCGEGYYTNAFQQALPMSNIYGFDLSKHALQQAAKAKSGVTYAVASIADVPLPNACADVVVSVFAPVFDKEIARILKRGGVLIKVEPGPKHLYDMKQVLYETVYDNEADAFVYEEFQLKQEEMVDYEMEIHGQEDIHALFQMTPYYYRSPKDTSAILLEKETLVTRIQFHIEVYEKR